LFDGAHEPGSKCGTLLALQVSQIAQLGEHVGGRDQSPELLHNLAQQIEILDRVPARSLKIRDSARISFAYQI
jgi:hypothetical protein